MDTHGRERDNHLHPYTTGRETHGRTVSSGHINYVPNLDSTSTSLPASTPIGQAKESSVSGGNITGGTVQRRKSQQGLTISSLVNQDLSSSADSPSNPTIKQGNAPQRYNTLTGVVHVSKRVAIGNKEKVISSIIWKLICEITSINLHILTANFPKSRKISSSLSSTTANYVVGGSNVDDYSSDGTLTSSSLSNSGNTLLTSDVNSLSGNAIIAASETGNPNVGPSVTPGGNTSTGLSASATLNGVPLTGSVSTSSVSTSGGTPASQGVDVAYYGSIPANVSSVGVVFNRGGMKDKRSGSGDKDSQEIRIITAAALESHQSLSLKKYLQNSVHRDIVYRKLIERVKRMNEQHYSLHHDSNAIPSSTDITHAVASMTIHTASVLTRVIELLRAYVPRYPPSAPVLLQLDSFFQSCLAPLDKNCDLAKSIIYVKSMVTTKHHAIPSISNVKTNQNTNSNSTTSSAPNLMNANNNNNNNNTTNPSTSANVSNNATTKAKKKRKGNEDEIAFVRNMMTLRSAPKKMPKRISNASLIETLMFGGQFTVQTTPISEDSPSVNSSNDEIYSYITSVIADELLYWHEEHGVREYINIMKRREDFSQNLYQDNLKRPHLQFFNYRYYKELQSQAQTVTNPNIHTLSLNKDQLDKVIISVIQPPQPTDRLRSSKILLKLLIDITCTDSTIGNHVLLSILFEILNSPSIDAKVHVFHILYNLSVNIYFFEEVPDSQELAPSTLNAQQAQSEIFSAFKEIVLHLLHSNESNPKLWLCAMDTLLYFVYRGGKINRTRLLEIDSRIIPTMLKILEAQSCSLAATGVPLIDDYTHKLLVRLLVNTFYPNSESGENISSKSLNVELLNYSCGIHFIIEEYTKVRSLEARGNLFVVIYDYIVYVLSTTTPPPKSEKEKITPFIDTENSSNQISMIFELLRWIDGPQYLMFLFKQIPEKFVERFLSFVQKNFETVLTTSAPATPPSSTSYPSKAIDKQLLLLFLNEGFEKLANSHSKVESEFDIRIGKMMKEGEIGDNMETLQQLLFSNVQNIATTSVYAVNSSTPSSAPHTIINSGSGTGLDPPATSLFISSVYQKLGETWLFELMKTYYTIGYISTLGANGTPSNPQVSSPNTPANSVTGLPNSKLQEAIDKLFLSMTESNIPSVRLSYLRVVEKLFLFIRSKANSLRASFDKQSTSSPDDTKANGLILLLNDLLGRLVKVNETNAYNLLYMFDIIFQFISVQVHAGYPFPLKTTESNAVPPSGVNPNTNLTTSNNANPEETERPDTVYSLFLNGDICVSLKLLNLVNINLLKHIFSNLPQGETVGSTNPDVSRIKIVLLYLIVQKSKNQVVFDTLGGLEFFKKILATTRDLYLLYIAGQFLVKKMEETEPTTIRNILSKIFMKAQEEEDENIVLNHFLQIKAVLTMLLPDIFVKQETRGNTRTLRGMTKNVDE